MIEIVFNNRQYHLKDLTMGSVDKLWQDVKRMNPNETRNKKEFLIELKELDTRHRNIMDKTEIRIPTKDTVNTIKKNGAWQIVGAAKNVGISFIESKPEQEIDFDEEYWGDDI